MLNVPLKSTSLTAERRKTTREPGRSCRHFTDTRQKYGLQAPVHTLTQRSLLEECTQTPTDAQHRPPCCETSFTQILGLWKITFFLMSGLSCVSLLYFFEKKDLFYRNRQFIAGSYKYGTHVFWRIIDGSKLGQKHAAFHLFRMIFIYWVLSFVYLKIVVLI